MNDKKSWSKIIKERLWIIPVAGLLTKYSLTDPNLYIITIIIIVLYEWGHLEQ